MADDITQISKLLNDTLSPDGTAISAATQSLDRLSSLPHFPFLLLSISSGGENQGLRVVAASYLKNFTRRNIDRDGPNSKVSKEFKDQLMRTLLQSEHAVLKVLVEVFRMIVVAEFVEKNSWLELVPELRSAIQNSDLIGNIVNCEWKTINALTVLQSLLRPFQYFLNPKVAKEPVPLQLDLIATEILVPLLSVFPHLVEKALSADDRVEPEHEKIILIVCKCMYFAIRSHMPSALVSLLPSFSCNLIRLLGSLRFDCGVAMEEEYSLKLKTGKRSLLIFSTLVTRHRKYCDKLMPDIINCALKIVKHSGNIEKLDFLPERIISLAFDVISRILETGPGWRLVSPHFSFLLESAIFPVLVLNEKDISEWEEDADEYLRKNLPSELEEISGLREDLFTARKSAMNLLGVISLSKGPPMGTSGGSSAKRKKGEKNKKSNQRSSMGELLVFPFLSKFPLPSDANSGNEKVLNDYVAVLMAYGGLQDFLMEQKPGYVSTLLRTRVLPLYTISRSVPFLVASANWVLGELASCLPEELSADIYSSLLKALAMLDQGEISCYPVRVSAAGAIAELIENDYHPPEWLPLLQVVINRINIEDEETSTLFQLLSSIVETGEENVTDHIPFMVSSIVQALSKHIYSSLEPWTQVIEKGFASLAVMTQSWESLMPEEIEDNESEKWVSGHASIADSLSVLLQRAWLTPVHPVDQEEESSPTPSCLDDSSTLLRSIIKSVTGSNAIQLLKLSELLLVWANMIAEWNAWAELEDLSVFDCIKEVVTLHDKYGLKNFIATQMPPPPAPPVPQGSIIECICTFVSKAISQYTSATWRACSCIHMLLHVPKYSSGNEGVKEALVITFSKAAYSHFRERQGKPSPVWKPLLLVISSCYLCFPDTVEGILGKEVEGGFTVWVSALNFACTNSSDNAHFTKSELKLTVMTLAKIIERLLLQTPSNGALLRDSFSSLLEASVKLKEVQEEDDEDNEEAEDNEDDEEEEEDDDDGDDDDEDSDDEHEETEEEFLQRYAQAAAELESNGVLEEGDLEDQEHEIDLGPFELVDERMVIFSTLERSRHVLLQMQALSPQLISRFLLVFPECSNIFSHG